jgi:predicted lipid-binding transport protein (Tim44 family)
VTSLLAALFGGFLMGIAAQVFFMYILSPTISSEVLQAQLIGQVAEITTPIPANGVGQIAFVAQGSRVTYSARATSEGESVIRGTPVRIERIVGGMAYVSRLD